MREILIAQSNVFALIILVSFAGLFSFIPRSISNETPTECTILDKQTGAYKGKLFASGTDCDAMRTLSEEGKPLPTIDSTAKPSP